MYKPLDHWMICDRCGSQYRKSDMMEEWTGLWVCRRGCWEQRHPQDFVEATDDVQTVDVSRPDVKQEVGETTLNGALSAWASSATLTAISGVADTHPVGIVMDNGIVHWTFVNGDPAGSVITLGSPITYAAASGNTVYLPGNNNETFQ